MHGDRGGNKRRITEEDEETFRDYEYIHYLDYYGEVTDMLMSQLINCSL